MILCVDSVHENGGRRKFADEKIRNGRGIKFREKREVKQSKVLKPCHRHQKMRRNHLIQ